MFYRDSGNAHWVTPSKHHLFKRSIGALKLINVTVDKKLRKCIIYLYVLSVAWVKLLFHTLSKKILIIKIKKGKD